MRIQAVQSSLFHERKQKEKESVDSYAQTIRELFHKAYPSAVRGSPEAESMGKSVLASQFASGLLPEIKVKVAGSEGDFETLLVKARFEEAKLRDLSGSSVKSRRPPNGVPLSRQQERPERSSEEQTVQKPNVRCYGCGSLGHYQNKCPARDESTH